MTETLIIRSASIQQLDLNLPFIKSRFEDSMVSVLTHGHGLKAVEKYSDIGRIYIYHHRSGFRFWHKATELADRRFEAAVVQTANVSGSGYLNVLAFAITLRAKKIFICNPCSEITEVKKSAIILRALLAIILKMISVILMLPMIIVLIVLLLRNPKLHPVIPRNL